jgi:hypothetical protein
VFKKVFLVIIFLVQIILLTSTPKEVDLPKNPRIQQVNVGVEKSVILEDLDSPQGFIIIDEKIYTVTTLGKSLAIYDLDGNVEKIYSENGRGPGEFGLPSMCYYDKKQNMISVVDNLNQKEVLFDLNGNFVKDSKFDPMNTPMQKYFVGDKVYQWSNKVSIDKDAGQVLVEPTVEEIESSEQKILFQTFFNPVKISLNRMGMPIVTSNDEKIFIGTYDIDKLQIKRFTKDGDVDLIINKEYSKTKRSEDEIAELKSKIEQYTKQAAQNIKIETDGYEYEYSIDFIFSDDTNLFVSTRDTFGSVIDVISENGIILKQLRKPKGKFGVCQVHDGKLFELTTNEEEDVILNIYPI